MGTSVHLLLRELKLLTSEVPPVLDLTKVEVCGLQLEVHLYRLMCPTTKDDILTLKPLHCVQCEGSLLSIRIQTCTLQGDDSIGVVLQVEQVAHVHGQVRVLEVE
jgi:hypothetical protein